MKLILVDFQGMRVFNQKTLAGLMQTKCCLLELKLRIKKTVFRPLLSPTNNQMNSTWLYHLQRRIASRKWSWSLPRKMYNFNSRCNIVRKLISQRVFQMMTKCPAYNQIPNKNTYLKSKNHHLLLLQNPVLLKQNLYRLKWTMIMYHPSMIMRYIRRSYKKTKRKRKESKT